MNSHPSITVITLDMCDGWKWIRMTPSCPHEHRLRCYTPSYIHSSVLSLWNFPQDIGCQDPPLWPSLHSGLFIVAWLISGNTRSHLHLFYWWVLLWWPQLAWPLHNGTRVLHVCMCEHVETEGDVLSHFGTRKSHIHEVQPSTLTSYIICGVKCN